MWLCSRSLARTSKPGAAAGGASIAPVARLGDAGERPLHQVPHPGVLEVARGRHDEVVGGVDAAEVVAQDGLGQRLHGLARAEDRPAQRVAVPEGLREQLVHEVVGGVLDHLDLLEDHLLLALDVVGVERRVQDHVRQHVERPRHVLVEHLDVVARVLLRGERVELPADRVDLLRDVLGAPRLGSLEQHVLDEVRHAALRLRLVPGPARQPDADADRADVGHRLGEQANPVAKHLADDHRAGSPFDRGSN